MMSEILKDTTANTIGTGSGGLKLDPAGTDIVTIGNGVMLPDGTKTAPAVRFTDDNNTGIYSPVNDQVAITGHGENVLVATGVVSSVNAVEVKSSVTGSPVEINAVGTDTNVSVNVTPKGTGTLKVAGTDVSLAGHNHTGTYEPADATILKDADIGVSVAAQSHNHDSAYVSVVTTPTTGNFPVLTLGGELDNSSYNAASFATAAHNHTGVYEPADATILKDADIGVTVAAQSHTHSGVYQPVDGDLTAIAALAGTAGILTKTAADTWSLDTSTYSTTAHSHTLDGLSDVTITTPASGNVLSYNGSTWVNSAPAGGGADSRIATFPATPTAVPTVAGTSATGQLAIGDGAVVAGNDNDTVAIGKSRAAGLISTAIGIGDNTSTYGATTTYAIAVGRNAKASGYASLAIGSTATASQNATVAVGADATASGASSVALGNTANAQGAYTISIGSDYTNQLGAYSIGIGSQATSNLEYSVVIGPRSAAATGINAGEWCMVPMSGFTGISTTTSVKAPKIIHLIMGRKTADATPTPLNLGGAASKLYYKMDTYAIADFKVRVMACKEWDNTSVAVFEFQFSIAVATTAASTRILGSVSKTIVARDVATWDCDVAVDTTNGGFIITATGEAGVTINWIAHVDGLYYRNS